MHFYDDLINLFNHCFSASHQTRLMKGEDEPIYLPAHDNQPYHELWFAHGFFASALHEVSHWLIAGEARRQQVDFGYWYVPDGRTKEQQERFLQAEVKPQAMEWILSLAAGYRFRISIDNLNGCETNTEKFKLDVHQQVKTFCHEGLNQRASTFRDALCQFYGTRPALRFEDFDISLL